MLEGQSPEAQYWSNCGELQGINMDFAAKKLQSLKCGCFTHILNPEAQKVQTISSFMVETKYQRHMFSDGLNVKHGHNLSLCS